MLSTSQQYDTKGSLMAMEIAYAEAIGQGAAPRIEVLLDAAQLPGENSMSGLILSGDFLR